MEPRKPLKIKTWNICITGFLQSEAKPTGMEKIWLRVGKLRGPETVVAMKRWDSNWCSYAELIFRTSVLNGETPVINVFAYSWGAGYGFIRLARELKKRGIRIQRAVLSDPVYKPRLRALSFMVFIRSLKVRVPNNVDHVDYFYQKNDNIRGHEVIAEDSEGGGHIPPRPIVLPRICKGILVRGVYHRYMDDYSKFRDKCLSVAFHDQDEDNT